MILQIPIPPVLFPQQRLLVVSDERVDFVIWKQGKIDIVNSFSNDQAGLQEFRAFLDSKKEYSGKSIGILLNIVGEDYRFELTPHLLGRYKINFLNKRKASIYRGSSFTQSFTLGREEIGKRQDLTLFIGVLTEDKVAPWAKILDRYNILLTGIYSQGMAYQSLIKSLNLGKTHAVITVFTGGNSIRQCYFHQGQLRHSRVTKLPPADNPAILMKAIAAESDRFQQYLTQLKIARGVRVEFRVILPTADMEDFQKGFKSVAGEKADRYFFYDAEQVSKRIGVKKPVNQWGSDYSIGVHCLYKSLNFLSLAPFSMVRFFWSRFVARFTTAAVAIYILYLIGIEAVGLSETYFKFQVPNIEATARVAQLKSTYDSQVAEFVEPPSTPENMRAVSNIFAFTSYEQINPSALLFYVSKAIQKNSTLIELKDITWYLTDDPNSRHFRSLAYLSGSDLYQVINIKGTFFERRNQTLEDVLANVDRFMEGFESRSDIDVELLEGPKKLDTSGNISGTASLETNVTAASRLTTLDFLIRVRWRQRDADFYGEIFGTDPARDA